MPEQNNILETKFSRTESYLKAIDSNMELVFIDFVVFRPFHDIRFYTYWYGSSKFISFYDSFLDRFFKNPKNHSLFSAQISENPYYKLHILNNPVAIPPEAEVKEKEIFKKQWTNKDVSLKGAVGIKAAETNWASKVLIEIANRFLLNKICFFRCDEDFSNIKYTSGVWIGFRSCSLDERVLEYICKSITYELNQFFIIHEILFELNSHATRAAISQVMARNMSHNIGSHVLSKFKDKVAIEDTIWKGQYTGIKNPEDDFKIHIARFNEYLKDRMDFLADIATTDPVMESSLYFIGDIIRRFDSNQVLLNRISGVECPAKFRLKIRKKVNGEWSDIKEGGEGFHYLNDDFPVSTPNDILGAQAWYIFLENIIRNIYKHDHPQKDFAICIDLEDAKNDKSFYEVSVYDTLCKPENIIKNVVAERNTNIDKKILKDNKLRDGGLGTIEMKVCAAFIRKQPVLDVEKDGYLIYNRIDKRIIIDENGAPNDISPNNVIFCAYKHYLDTNKCPNYNQNEFGKPCNRTDCFTLGYKFFVSKPKEVVVVIKDPSTFKVLKDGKDISLHDNGILVVTASEIEDKVTYPQQFLYLVDSLDNMSKLENKANLPKRVIYTSNQIKLDQGKDEFVLSLWNAYFNDNIKSFIYRNILFKTDTTELYLNTEKLILSEGNENKETNFFKVFIDNHSKEYNNLVNNPDQYYDMACNYSLIKKHEDNLLLNRSLRIALEYLESIKLKILVIDERIQQSIVFEEKTYNEVPLYNFFKSQHLIIPFWKIEDVDTKNGTENRNEVNLNAEKLDESKLKCFLGKHKKDVDFIVIHLGLLERLIEGEKTEFKVTEKIDSLLGNEYRHKLVLTSGRGSPQTAPDDIRYLPVSVLQYAIETVHDKFYLTKALFNTRNIQKYGN
jgi:fructose-specific phosphotransferase system component IIB